MPVNINCKHCSKEFSVRPCKAETAKYCSKECKWAFNNWSSEPNTVCTQCDKEFHLKPSAKKRYKRTHGYFCSNICVSNFRSSGVYSGAKNPNYKKGLDHDGYKRLEAEHCNRLGFGIGMKLHQAVCCEVLGIKKITKGFHVHHRDCDILNNVPENLVILSISDHKWLHKQFGNATLWAHYHKKVSTNTLVSWSDDKERALRLLDINVTMQANTSGFGSTGVN